MASEALIHSAQVRDHIRSHIIEKGGWISFADYMEMALYAPGLGYYVAGNQKLGQGGDFTTAPEISPLFAQCFAQFYREHAMQLGDAILEIGPGSGRLAFDLLSQLASTGSLPKTYYLLEVSPDLVHRQKTLLSTLSADLNYQVDIQWLNQLPSNFSGMVIANEVLDAMPFQRFEIDAADDFHELGVVLSPNGENFCWGRAALSSALAAQVEPIFMPILSSIPKPYINEFSAYQQAFLNSLSEILIQGHLVLIDYGYVHSAYYHPQKSDGNMRCFYQHRLHHDPFFNPGIQDITANVNFSYLLDMANNLDLSVDYFGSQARFLLEQGLLTLAETAMNKAIEKNQKSEAYKIAQAINILTAPQEMGELVKVLILSRASDLQ